MTDWDNLVEPTRGALEALLRKGDEMADRIEELEAKLAKATDTLVRIVRGDDDPRSTGRMQSGPLAELKGQNQ
jgi:hypothetical protein